MQDAGAARPAVDGRYLDGELEEIRSAFVPRLRQAFDDASNAEIARRLNTSDATIKNYMDAKRLPLAEMLIEIARVTGINLHWLLTGQGPQRVEKGSELLTPEENKQILALARRAGRTYNEQLQIVIRAALDFADRL